MFVGRKHEINQLDNLYGAKESAIVAIYGRRRIGKSSLVDEFLKIKSHLRFEGLEGVRTPGQIEQVTSDIARQIKDPLLSQMRFMNWDQVFNYLTTYFKKKRGKTILFFDELQWLAAGQSLFIATLKKYWDNEWKQLKVFLILCGSVSSYMVKRVVKSKALYGRIDLEICLEGLEPDSIYKLLNFKRSKDEVFKYMMLMGGVPKYLESIDTTQSLSQNMNRLAFVKGGLLFTEYEKVFYSQFREHRNYEKIVELLSKGSQNIEAIGERLKMSSGGGLKSYLTNLETALFVTSYVPFNKKESSRIKKYKLTDEYIRFYCKYIQPHKKLISGNKKRNIFTALVEKSWEPWLGIAFENFCLKNALFLAEKMGFVDQVINYGPYFEKSVEGFQIDLLFERSDRTITMCEIKYHDQKILPSIIREVERKATLFPLPKGYTLETALISRFGSSKVLKESGYFHHEISIPEFFSAP